jgi:hypothetical protein
MPKTKFQKKSEDANRLPGRCLFSSSLETLFSLEALRVNPDREWDSTEVMIADSDTNKKVVCVELQTDENHICSNID